MTEMDLNIERITAIVSAAFSGVLVSAYWLRRYWPSEAQLRDAEGLVAEHKRRARIAAQWPALLALVAQHEAELARSVKRPRSHLADLLTDESGGEFPIALHTALRVAGDDFSGGPSSVSGPHRKIGDSR